MYGKDACFEISNIEQIKGIPKGRGKTGMLGFHDTLRVPIIENTAFEEDLTESLEKAMEAYPDTYAVLVCLTPLIDDMLQADANFVPRSEDMVYTCGVTM